VRASGRPKHCWPAAHLAAKPSRRCGRHTRSQCGSGQRRLRHELELLAHPGRLRLQAPIEPVSQPAEHSAVTTLGLTPREAEVLALVAEGRTNRQIGQALFITPKTASLHVSRILAKLGVAGRGEAAAIAHRLGLDQR
jgi:DNA-binding CsgD family transcriptional regulator